MQYIDPFFFNIQVFGAFGPVELVQLPLDETGQCKGFGFVQVCAMCTQRLCESGF